MNKENILVVQAIQLSILWQLYQGNDCPLEKTREVVFNEVKAHLRGIELTDQLFDSIFFGRCVERKLIRCSDPEGFVTCYTLTNDGLQVIKRALATIWW